MSDAPLSFSADDVISGQAQTRLRTLIERIERLEEDKAAILADVKEVYAEAKGEGFNVKILRRVVSLRKIDKVKRDEEETILDLYLTAIGDRLPMDLPIQHKPRSEKITQPSPPLQAEGVAGEVASKAEGRVETEGAPSDPLYDDAVSFVRLERKASTSFIQRKLQIGYNRAAALMERMEAEEIVSPANYVGKREILDTAPA